MERFAFCVRVEGFEFRVEGVRVSFSGFRFFMRNYESRGGKRLVKESLLQPQVSVRTAQAAPERNRNDLKHFKGSGLNAKARIWP